MTMWSIWAVTELEPHTLKVQNEKDARLRRVAIAAARKPFAVLDAALAQKGFAVGERFTVADINLAEVVRYAVSAPELPDGAPNVRSWLERCQSRTAFQEMWKKREAEPF